MHWGNEVTGDHPLPEFLIVCRESSAEAPFEHAKDQPAGWTFGNHGFAICPECSRGNLEAGLKG